MIQDAISFWTEIQRYENMLAADPRSYCFVPLSELYRKLNLLDDAISVAVKGCSMHPDYPGGFFALGAAFHAKGEKADAIKALEVAIDLKPDHTDALKLLGELYVEDGRLDMAEKVLRQVLEHNPHDTEMTLLLHSIAGNSAPEEAGAASEMEDEVLEEADLVEELTEVLDEQAFEDVDDIEELPPVAEPAADLFDESSTLWESGEEEPVAAEPLAPFDDEPFPAAPAAADTSRLQPGRDPLSTPTMAELYVSQGFVDKALGIYRDLAAADPGNGSYRQRLAELEASLKQQEAGQSAPQPAAPATAIATPVQPATQAARQPAATPGGDLEAELTCWLQNIRRRRDGV